jgi:hypothetical protein
MGALKNIENCLNSNSILGLGLQRLLNL